MRYRFDGVEVDTENRELMRDGQLQPLQPQAFNLLSFLIRHRDRVVSKAELLAELWPDAVVGEGSIQRAVHLVRAALADDGTAIRTVPKLGYRFVATVEEVHAVPPPQDETFSPRFVRCNDGVHVAYQTFGQGALDIVVVPGWAFPMRAFFDHPDVMALLRSLGALGRVILFDKRGTGLSDRIKELPTLERRMDDLRAVLDAVGSRRALLVGFSEGGPLCVLYATSYPQRTHGLLLVGSFARWSEAADYDGGWSSEAIARLREYIEREWGAGETIRAIVESRASDPEIETWARRAEQEGASPGAALDLLDMNLQIDVRPLLPALGVPVVVLHHRADLVIDVESGRFLARSIPGARLVEVAGRDHAFFFEDRAQLLDAVKWLMQERESEAHRNRFLTTVLVVQLEDDVPFDRNGVVSEFRGSSTGRALAWHFDGPQRAIACGHALVGQRDIRGPVRVGIHTGEVSREGGDIVGEALDAAACVAHAAAPGEVRVTRVVRDLVHGAALTFDAPAEVAAADGRTLVTFASEPPPRG